MTVEVGKKKKSSVRPLEREVDEAPPCRDSSRNAMVLQGGVRGLRAVVVVGGGAVGAARV